VPGFVGRFDHSLDAKGRVILPARFRPSFERGGYLALNFERCLSLWTPGEFDRQSSEMQATFREGTPEARNFARIWASGSVDIEIDRQGRMGIPSHLREFAGLTTEVLVTGAIDHIELWDPEEWRVRVAPAQAVFLGETE
jgi:MraZ protein